jgi:protein involved in polysaccharide export with SLBB domain
MQKILPLFFAAAVFAVGACSNHQDKPKKSAAHIYPGDAPTIKFMDEPEAAGGPIKGY